MPRSLTSFLKCLARPTVASLGVGLLAAGAVLLLQACASSSRKSYASAPYDTSVSEGSFSIRQYPALKVARTSSGGGNEDGSFMKLFRYIGGANAGKEEISMTTPVLIEKSTMSFVMPESHQKTAPRASDQQVEVTTLPARRLAVCSYSGNPEGKNREEALAKLRAWLGARKVAYVDEPVFAVYDGPFTLPSQRLNEVMLPLR